MSEENTMSEETPTELPPFTDEHPITGRVSATAFTGENGRIVSSAATYVCARAECIAQACKWAEGVTGGTPIYQSYGSSDLVTPSEMRERIAQELRDYRGPSVTDLDLPHVGEVTDHWIDSRDMSYATLIVLQQI